MPYSRIDPGCFSSQPDTGTMMGDLYAFRSEDSVTSIDAFLDALPAYYGPARWPSARAELAQAWHDLTGDQRWDGSTASPAPMADDDLTWLGRARSLQNARHYQALEPGRETDYRLTGYRATASGYRWTMAEAPAGAPAGILAETDQETGEVLWCDARRCGQLAEGHQVPGKINAFPVDLPTGPDLPGHLISSPVVSPDEGHLLGELDGIWRDGADYQAVGLTCRYASPATMAAADHLVADGLAVPVWEDDTVMLFITVRGQLALHRYRFRGRWESWPLGAAVAAWEDPGYSDEKRLQVCAVIARLHRYPEPAGGYTADQMTLIWEAASREGQRWIDRVSLPVTLGLAMLAQLGPMLAVTLCQAIARDMAAADPDRYPDDLEPAWKAVKRAEAAGLVVTSPYGRAGAPLLERTLVTPVGGPHQDQNGHARGSRGRR